MRRFVQEADLAHERTASAPAGSKYCLAYALSPEAATRCSWTSTTGVKQERLTDSQALENFDLAALGLGATTDGTWRRLKQQFRKAYPAPS